MKSSLLLIVLIIFSCSPEHKAVNEKLIVSILENYIEEDSLYDSDYIYPALLPYIYYEPQYSEEGFEFPPPPSSNEGEYLNEEKLIERLESEEYFSLEKDAQHIKHQIHLSGEAVPTLSLSSLSKKEFEFSPNEAASWYTFYLPIFNHDSSAVYVQFDLHYGSEGLGNGAILVRKNGEWSMIKWIPRWMT